jgi:hypothetical protein
LVEKNEAKAVNIKIKTKKKKSTTKKMNTTVVTNASVTGPTAPTLSNWLDEVSLNDLEKVLSNLICMYCHSKS